MQEREFQNMFIFSPGFEAATLKIPSKDQEDDMTNNNLSNNGRKQIIGFAKFRTRFEALEAKEILSGRRVDAEKGSVLKAEMAKKNLHTKRGFTSSTVTTPNNGGLPSPGVTSPTGFRSFGALGISTNPADQNPPCNTLYVGNLPPNASEDELKAMFSSCVGYQRLSFRNKSNGPMCFVEFEDIACATQAMQDLYGNLLSNSVKGGIRLSFSKNPLVRHLISKGYFRLLICLLPRFIRAYVKTYQHWINEKTIAPATNQLNHFFILKQASDIKSIPQ
ncbi:hypothetical protein BDB00DRAFT_919169 [Zychaea mexicana]|uniref:uncharacterized protein n=1 Tax=Zychaea mexicana TaxID=64656 RepID=UPI0022FDB339|nr:uncharacterized protein BDB00DRAFT_919169 [Zychaea mexicana]KAI9497764.1 hypothetical protein BDB00DRAFT_919169 [Zychaea mexicana]